jgi:hypothetical protein
MCISRKCFEAFGAYLKDVYRAEMKVEIKTRNLASSH